MAITITEPQAFSRITNVKCVGTGPSGSICACGTAVDASYSASDASYGGINGVWAKALPLGTIIPASPPPGAQTGSYDATTGNWWFLGTQLVPNVPCLAAPTDNTYLFAVWCSYAGGTAYDYQATRIAAKCATATNCDGSPDPCAGVSLRLRRAVASAATGTGTVSTAPRQYQVKGQGARGPLASLVNTTWALALKTGGCGCTFAWDNEGDGIRVPRVVLRPDGLISTEWNLTLVLNGRRAHYTCPAPKWKALGVNRMRRASGDDGLPKTLTVTPV